MSLPECTVNTNNIQNLPDSPTMTADELKQEFDKSGKDIKNYINEILLPAVQKLVNDEKSNLEKSMTEKISKEKEKLEISIKDKILEDNKKKYYVGKIIIDTANTNPETYLGFGTWEYWGEGKVPVGVDENDEDFNVVEKTGGEKSHKLTIDEMPSHRHILQRGSEGNSYFHLTGKEPQKGSTLYSTPTDYTGGDKAHNNIQPYITCYMWKRIA